jgi:glycerol-3-phosphate dehydrogenase (NAD(P)+)
MQQKMTITILGSGMWGRALAKLAAHNARDVRLWGRSSQVSLAQALEDTDIILSAVAMGGVGWAIAQLQSLPLNNSPILVTATKGLDPLTCKTPSQLWAANFPYSPLVVISGPNLSKEIEQDLPGATVVASHNLAAAQKVQQLFASDSFRVYLNQDPLGTELGGTLKNVVAIASGVCDGLKLGTNAKAALLTRALPEVVRVGTYLGGQEKTFFGLSGLGDLLATCNSPLSRNYQVGYRLAQGESLEEILATLEGTAEGLNTTAVLMKIAENQGLYMPIVQQVSQLLQGKITPQLAVKALMERDLKNEFS